jgi:hypothetical protein
MGRIIHFEQDFLRGHLVELVGTGLACCQERSDGGAAFGRQEIAMSAGYFAKEAVRSEQG